jgi:glycosyltransferase involved in cell wall biosynthesis
MITPHIEQINKFDTLSNFFLMSPIENYMYEQISKHSKIDAIHRSSFVRHVSNIIGPIAFNPKNLVRREAFESLYVETQHGDKNTINEATPPSKQGFENLKNAIIGNTADQIYIVGNRGSGKTMAINRLLSKYWEELQSKDWVVFRGDIAKLIDNLENIELFPVKVSILSYSMAHAFYVILKNGHADPLLSQLVSNKADPFIQYLNFKKDGSNKLIAGGHTKTITKYWRFVREEYKKNCEIQNHEGDKFSIQLAVEMEKKWPNSLRILYEHFVNYITKRPERPCRLLMIIDGVDNLPTGETRSANYKRLIEELKNCLPRGENSALFSKILIALRGNTKYDLLNSIEASNLPQPGRGAVEFVLSKQDSESIVVRRLEEIAKPQTLWSEELRTRFSAEELRSFSEYGAMLNVVAKATIVFSKKAGLRVPREHRSLDDSFNFSRSFSAMFNSNLRAMSLNIFFVHQYLQRYFPQGQREHLNPEIYARTHGRIILEASILAGHPVFTSNSDNQIKGRWCPNLFEWTPIQGAKQWGGLILLRVLQLLSACPGNYSYQGVIDILNLKFNYIREAIKEALDWAFDFGLIEHQELIWAPGAEGMVRRPSLGTTEKGIFVMKLPFSSVPVSYFMGVVSPLSRMSMRTLGTRDDLLHKNELARKFRLPALNTALILMRQVVSTHNDEVDGFSDTDFATFRLPSLRFFKHEASLYFGQLNEEERKTIISRLNTFYENSDKSSHPIQVGLALKTKASPIKATIKKMVLVVATEWDSQHGGLSTFNRFLCSGLAKSDYIVACLVPAATQDEIDRAKKSGVNLILAPATDVSDPLSGLSRKPKVEERFYPDFIIGHARITGLHAQTITEDFFPKAKRLHFVHMAAGEIEFYKDHKNPGYIAEQRENLEKNLCKNAYGVVAVGQRLWREFENLLWGAGISSEKLFRFDPGMDVQTNTNPTELVQCLVLGRAEDIDLKGIDIAVKALSQIPQNQNLTKGGLHLVVRGATKGSTKKLYEELKQLCNINDINIRIREYTSDVETIAEDIRRASILLMPSRSEGFGLVALEALAHGVPVLASDKSGFVEHITEYAGDLAQFCIVKTDDNLNASVLNWANAIQRILNDRTKAFNQARTLRDALASKTTWNESVNQIMQAVEISVKTIE